MGLRDEDGAGREVGKRRLRGNERRGQARGRRDEPQLDTQCVSKAFKPRLRVFARDGDEPRAAEARQRLDVALQQRRGHAESALRRGGDDEDGGAVVRIHPCTYGSVVSASSGRFAKPRSIVTDMRVRSR